MPTSKKLHERLRRLRGTISQEQVAASIGRSYHYYYLMEAGKKLNPSLDVLTKLADFYGISIDELVGHKINKDPKCDWWLPDKRRKK